MKTYKELTTDELEFIIENYRRMSFGELAEHLSTTPDDIHTAIKEWRAVNRNVPLARVPEDQYSDQWKQEVVEYYRNHSLSTTVYYFFTQNNIVRNVLKEYGIPEHDRATSLEFSKIEQYGSIAVGLFHEDTLISVMTFGKPRYNKKYQYELLRYCSNYHVVGGAEKLFTYFIQHYNPESIISYCDDSKFIGDVYKNLGFTHIATNIGKHWYNMSTQKHVTDNLLRQRGFDQIFGTSYGKGTSNEELMLANKFVEIYDAGQSTYVWKQVD